MSVVTEGTMEIIDGRSGTHITDHTKGEFSGDIDVLSGRPAIVSAIASTDLELLQIPGDCVRAIVGEIPKIGDVILRAFLMRRALLQEMELAGPLIVGSRYSSATLRIREFLATGFPSLGEDLEANPGTSKILEEFHVTEDHTPVVILPNGDLLQVPTNARLGKALGLNRTVESTIYDLVVVGAGPAGLAAAVYGASEGLNTLVLDADGPGGQAGTSSRIENYMGFPMGLSGQDLADRAVIQAERFGARMVVPGCVSTITCNHHGGHELDVDGVGKIESKCVILTPGAAYRKLEIEEPDKYEGRGLYYAATNVERVLCGASEVAVVGAGNSAGQAAVFLSEGAQHVYLIVRGDDLRKSMSSYLAQRIERSEKITVLLDAEVTALTGDDYLQSAAVTNKKTGKASQLAISGIFIMIGAIPHTDWLPAAIERDDKGFIITGQQLVQEGKWNYPRPLMPRSPRRRILFCHRRRRIEVHRTRLGVENLRRLDISNGCQDHAVLPYALAPFVCVPPIAHGSINPPCHHVSRLTLPRPPHPMPNVCDDHDTPLSGPGRRWI